MRTHGWRPALHSAGGLNRLGPCAQFSRALVPAESQIHKKIPDADKNDGDEIGEIHVQMQPIDLNIQERHTQSDSRYANEIKLRETQEALTPADPFGHRTAKGPNIVPDKIVENRYFRRDHFAQAEVPPHHGR